MVMDIVPRGRTIVLFPRGDEQASKALKSVTAKEFNRQSKRFNSSTVLYCGNLAPSELTLLLDAIHVGGPSIRRSGRPSAIKDGKHLVKSSPSRKKVMRSATSGTESATRIFLQLVDGHSPRLRALGSLFVSIFRDLFLESLRHEKRLGYTMHFRHCEHLDQTGISLYIQGHNQTSESLDGELEAFLQQSLGLLSGMSPELFDSHRHNLLAILQAGPSSPLEEAQSHWAEITLRRYDFDRSAKEAASLEQISRGDMQEFIRDYIIRDAPKRRAVSIHVSPRP